MEEMMTAQDQAMMFEAPIPGSSLTSDPENPQPYETPPQYTDLEDFIDGLADRITKEENLDGILDPIRKGVALEDVTQLLLFKAMSSGKINVDLMMMAIEPTLYLLIGLSEYAGIENPVLYPEDDMIDEDEDQISMLKEAIGDEDVDFEDRPVPQGVSKSLLEKVKGVKDGN